MSGAEGLIPIRYSQDRVIFMGNKLLEHWGLSERLPESGIFGKIEKLFIHNNFSLNIVIYYLFLIIKNLNKKE